MLVTSPAGSWRGSRGMSLIAPQEDNDGIATISALSLAVFVVPHVVFFDPS